MLNKYGSISNPRGVLRGLFVAVLACGAVRVGVAGQAVPAQDVFARLQDGIDLYDRHAYREALATLTDVIKTLHAADPRERKALVAAHEYRASSDVFLGDLPSADADFSAILRLSPAYTPDDTMSPKIRDIWKAARTRLIGDLMVGVTPDDAGATITVAETSYPAEIAPLAVPLPAGTYSVVVKRNGYGTQQQTATIVAATTTSLTFALVRTSASLRLRTTPPGVAVRLDNTIDFSTGAEPGAEGLSAVLEIPGLANGAHELQFTKACYKPATRQFSVTEMKTLEYPPIALDPDVARVTLRISESEYAVLLDDQRVPDPAKALTSLCVGDHRIEVRSPDGRFVDKRYWKAGDVETLNVVLRPAFALVLSAAPAGVNTATFVNDVSLALRAPGGSSPIFSPNDDELKASVASEGVLPDFFQADTGSVARRRREIGEQLSTRFNSQGIAAIGPGGGPDSVRLWLLAAGSADPELLVFDLNDASAVGRAARALAAELPSLVQVSLDALLVDVADNSGPMIARVTAGGAASTAGLNQGDTILQVGNIPVTSVEDALGQLSGRQGKPTTLAVRSVGGDARTASVTPTLALDTLPLEDRHVVYNTLYLRIQNQLKNETDPIVLDALWINRAIVDMRLKRWGEAIEALDRVKLSDGPGVSAGTVAYLTGLCDQATGRDVAARTAFTKAAASAESLLSIRGPRIAPLAEQALRTLPPR